MCNIDRYKNINGRWIINIKVKAVKTPQQNPGKHICHHEVGKDFLGHMLNIKENIMNWTSSKLKPSTVEKTVLNKLKNKTSHRVQEIFATNISNKVFMLKICKEPLQPNHKKKNIVFK